MACFELVHCYQLSDGKIVFRLPSRDTWYKPLSLACGKCIGCLTERARQWSVRIMHEASLYERNCFVTLTYDDAHCPTQLEYPHFQFFMRELRRTHSGVRFFMCGEYGSLNHRPHFHACLFNLSFTDLLPVARGASGDVVFESKELSKFWKFGFASVGELSHRSASYVARYSLKKSPNDDCFVRMSLKPGIGARWFDKFKSDVFPHDRVIVNGRSAKPPKYYDRRMVQSIGSVFNPSDCLDWDSVVSSREKRALQGAIDDTRSRRSVRSAVLAARLNLNKRSL